MITAYYDPGYEAPLGDHVMPIRKFRLVAEALRSNPEVELRRPSPVTEDDLLRVHSRGYVDAVRTGQPPALAESQKLPWSPDLYRSVTLTNGGVLAAAARALETGVAAALASGFHHASADHGEGFCTFNGLVVAAEALRTVGRIERVAVIDLDLHYGNGTAQLAAKRDWLSVLSIYGNDYWDNTPYQDTSVRRHQDGPNHYSVPLPAGCSGTFLLEAVHREAPRLLDARPDLLLYQAGADPYHEDPYSPLDLDHADLLARDCAVFEFAKTHGLPIAWVLAGGYTKDVTQVVKVHTNTFEAALGVHT